MSGEGGYLKMDSKKIKDVLRHHSELTQQIHKQVLEIREKLDEVQQQTIEMASYPKIDLSQEGGGRGTHKDLADVYLRYQKLVNEQEEQLAAEMHVLTIHAEGIHRLYLCFQTLIGEEHDIIDRLYVKGELYKSVEQDMGLNHRIFEGKRKQAIRDIQKLADIIEADGMVLQDLLVKKLDADEYKIIAGHKRHAACKLLVEERGKKEFEFLPCFEQNISDIQAEFQIYSSNCHHEETPYEIMHKLERMQYLINNYPEEFPEIQGGRMVDRLAKKYNLSKSTVGEYLTISKNLGDTAMDEFQKGEIDKSAAVTLASMPEENQNQALSQGRKTDKELKAYKKEVLEPTSNEIRTAYDELDIREIDCPDRKETCKKLIERYGKSHLGQTSDTINISCTPKTITINGKEITWNRFVKLIEKVIPAYQVEVQAKKEKKKLYFEKRELQVSYETYDRLISGQQRCILVKDDTYQEAELVDIYAIGSDGSETEPIEFTITYINKQDSGIEKGYSILNLEMIPIFC